MCVSGTTGRGMDAPGSALHLQPPVLPCCQPPCLAHPGEQQCESQGCPSLMRSRLCRTSMALTEMAAAPTLSPLPALPPTKDSVASSLERFCIPILQITFCSFGQTLIHLLSNIFSSCQKQGSYYYFSHPLQPNNVCKQWIYIMSRIYENQLLSVSLWLQTCQCARMQGSAAAAAALGNCSLGVRAPCHAGLPGFLLHLEAQNVHTEMCWAPSKVMVTVVDHVQSWQYQWHHLLTLETLLAAPSKPAGTESNPEINHSLLIIC